MFEDSRRARDLQLLDAIDAFKREQLNAEVWRLAREGRDPLLGAPSRSRWCDGKIDVLYTSLEYDGAVAEIHALLNLQPVFPSRDRWFAHKLKVSAAQTLRLADLKTLGKLGVDPARYPERDYARTQEIAGAAYFLGFDGLIAPSARWACLNLVLFTDRIPPGQVEVIDRPIDPVAWDVWRKRTRPHVTKSGAGTGRLAPNFVPSDARAGDKSLTGRRPHETIEAKCGFADPRQASPRNCWGRLGRKTAARKQNGV